MKNFVKWYAAICLLTCIPMGFAASIPYFTGPTGSNPVTGTSLGDMNAMIQSVNSNLAIPASQTTAANGAVATVLGSLGPTGSHTTVQEWLVFTDASGNVRYVPAF